jgi:hypothetical protein
MKGKEGAIMAANRLRVEDLVFRTNNGLVLVEVPREYALEIHWRLEVLGIGSSLYAGEEDEAVVVHAHTNLAPARVRALLAGQGWPRRHGGDRGTQGHKRQS